MKFIQSRDNPLVKEIRRLAESGRERKKSGLTLLEGVHLVEAYEAAIGPVRTLVASERGGEQAEICRYMEGREVTVLADGVFNELVSVDSPSGILAVASQPAVNGAIQPDADTLVLDGIQDPGNLGTLLRTAAAAGFGQVALSTDCVGAWSPKVLRAGQGAHFVLEIHEGTDLADFLAGYQGTSLATSLQDAQPLYQTSWQGPVAWIFGSEGQGVRPAILAAATYRVTIPMPGRVESLNVGAAAAICLFETVRRRLK